MISVIIKKISAQAEFPQSEIPGRGATGYFEGSINNKIRGYVKKILKGKFFLRTSL